MGLIDFITMLNAGSQGTTPPDETDWILEDGFWNDDEHWNDEENWID